MPRKRSPKTSVKEFGQRLRQLRKSRSWTQVQLAEKVGVDRAVIGNYELGLHYPTISVLTKLAECLDVSADKLLGLRQNGAVDIQDRRLYQLFVEVDQADFGTQGLVKQLIESVLFRARLAGSRTGTDG